LNLGSVPALAGKLGNKENLGVKPPGVRDRHALGAQKLNLQLLALAGLQGHRAVGADDAVPRQPVFFRHRVEQPGNLPCAIWQACGGGNVPVAGNLALGQAADNFYNTARFFFHDDKLLYAKLAKILKIVFDIADNKSV